MARLDPELRYLLDEYQASVTAGTVLSEADTWVEVLLYYADDLGPVITAGFRVDSYHGSMAAGHLLLRDFVAVSDQPNVERIIKPPRLHVGLKDSIPDIRANQVRTVNTTTGTFTGTTGKGVIVGIIDSGIDYLHKAFRVGNTSRILRIWDQSATLATEPSTGKQAPTVPASIVNPKGVEYVQAKITEAIAAADPATVVGHTDVDGHGTNVAGIAAGNGSQNGACHGAYTYIGVAPEADLIIVKLDSLGRTSGGASGGPTISDLLRGIDYIAYHAQRPELRNPAPATMPPQRAAVNLSIFSLDGSHDGKGVIDEAINKIQTDNTNTLVIVTIAGNDGAIDLHAQADVPASGFFDLAFEVQKTQPLAITEVIDIWYAQAQSLTCSVKPPDGVFTAAADQQHAQQGTGVNNGGNVLIGSLTTVSSSPDNNFHIQLVPSAGGQSKVGSWTIRLTNPNPAPVPFHAWIITNSNNQTGTVFKTAVSHQCTIGTPGSAQETITVGSYQTGTFFSDGKLSDFSSRGPLRGAPFQKPDLMAPGESITAPAIASERNQPADYLCFKCCCDCWADFYVPMDGTSQAGPHVTGAVALILQADPTMTHTQVKNLLIGSVRVDADTGSATPNPDWGWGKLDVQDAVRAASPTPPSPAPSPPTPIVALPHRQLAELQERFMHSTHGTQWRGLLRPLAQEINQLINTNKRVATVWHRNGGPAWVRVALQMAATPSMPLPEVANGHRLQTGLDNMRAMLKRYGSAPLVGWLSQTEPELALVQPGRSLLQLLDLLEQAEV